jgi:integrase
VASCIPESLAASGFYGDRKVRFHDLRHTFWYSHGGGRRLDAHLAGLDRHRDFATTLRYADYQPAVGEAALVERAFAGAHQTAHQTERQSATSDHADRA